MNAPSPVLRDQEMRLFQELIYREAGIRLPDAKTNLVQGRLRKRLEALGLDSYRTYHAFVVQPGHDDELQRCLEALTTNETFFFRHNSTGISFSPTSYRSGSAKRHARQPFAPGARPAPPARNRIPSPSS